MKNERGNSPHYLSFMLRLWLVDGSGAPAWRASLEDAHTGRCYGFGSPEALFAFLAELIQASTPANPQHPRRVAPGGAGGA